MKAKVIRTHPELWEACKEEAVRKMGKFSARAMQHAVVLYKERGGGYLGMKSPENPLVRWNSEEKATKRKSGDEGNPMAF